MGDAARLLQPHVRGLLARRHVLDLQFASIQRRRAARTLLHRWRRRVYHRVRKRLGDALEFITDNDPGELWPPGTPGELAAASAYMEILVSRLDMYAGSLARQRDELHHELQIHRNSFPLNMFFGACCVTRGDTPRTAQQRRSR